MNKNKIFSITTFIVLCLSVITITNATTGCYFNSFSDENCPRIDSVINKFKLDEITDDKFLKYDVEIINKRNPSNKIKISDIDESFNFDQIEPFLEIGTYKIVVNAIEKNGLKTQKIFEYIFDNTDIMPPSLPIHLNNSIVKVSARNGYTVFAEGLGIEKNCEIKKDDYNKYNCELDLGLSNTDENIHYIKFHSEYMGKKSTEVERVLRIINPTEDSNTTVLDIQLDSFETFTNKQNQYISGKISPAKSGIPVYVNGEKTLTDNSGNFGTFTLLNEGDNKIEIVSNDFSKITQNIFYQNLRFMFTNVEIPKITQENTIQITGNTNFDYEFYIVLNGELKNTITSENGIFNQQLTELKPGKNIIELRGINNQILRKIVYFDTENPTIQSQNFESTVNLDKLSFLIKDDLGINLDTIELQIDGKIIENAKLKTIGNLYLFDISELDSATSYLLTVSDLVGKTVTISGNIGYDKNLNFFSDVKIKENENVGLLYGNTFYFNKQENIELLLTPIKNIAFKHIYLDNQDQINYKILNDNSIELKLEKLDNEGTIYFNYIDEEYIEQTREYKYKFLTKDKQIFELDYVLDSYTTDKIKISGSVENELFDWNTFEIEGENNFIKYGKYFEADVWLTKSNEKNNLQLSGFDILKNYFKINFGGISYLDSTKTQTSINQENLLNKKLSIQIDDEIRQDKAGDYALANYNYLTSYDGFNFNKLYLNPNIEEIPFQERSGMRLINLKGFESSKNRFNLNGKINIENRYGNNLSDKVKENFYFTGNDIKTDKKDFNIQGMIISRTKPVLTMTNGICENNQISFICSVKLNDGENNFSLKINGITKNISIEKVPKISVKINDIIGNGISYIGNYYYLGYGEVKLNSIVNTKANLNLLLEGNLIKTLNKKGEFNLSISEDIKNSVKEFDKKVLNVELVASDEFGNKENSNIIGIYYKKFIDMFVSLIIEN